MKRREEREKEEERQRKEREQQEKRRRAEREKEQFDIDAARAESCAEALLKEEAEKAAAAESGNKKKKKNKKKKSRTSHGTQEETAEDAEVDDKADDVRVAPASIDYQALLLARLREMDLDPALAKGVCYDLRDVEEAVDAILAKQYVKPFRSTLNPHAAVFVPATC